MTSSGMHETEFIIMTQEITLNVLRISNYLVFLGIAKTVVFVIYKESTY